MRRRRLGQSDLEVPVVVFGAWAIGGWNWGGTDDEQAVRAIQAAIDSGMTTIDTAPVYGFGHSETVVGRALAGRRDSVLVMTKVGLRWDDAQGDVFFETAGLDGVKRTVRRNSAPASVKHEVEASLVRLRTDRIDLIQVHWHDPRTPIQDTMNALLELKSEGKVRAIGVSNYSVEQMKVARRALGDVPLASNQPKYSLVAREIEREILPFCAESDIGVMVYSPLEQGLLTGRVTADRTFAATDGRHKRPTFTPTNRALVNAVLRRVVQPIAERHGATLGQVAIAWTVAQRGVTSAIVGARTPAQAIENARAGDLVLTPPEIQEIRAAFETLALEVPAPAPAKSGWKALAKRLLGR